MEAVFCGKGELPENRIRFYKNVYVQFEEEGVRWHVVKDGADDVGTLIFYTQVELYRTKIYNKPTDSGTERVYLKMPYLLRGHENDGQPYPFIVDENAVSVVQKFGIAVQDVRAERQGEHKLIRSFDFRDDSKAARRRKTGYYISASALVLLTVVLSVLMFLFEGVGEGIAVACMGGAMCVFVLVLGHIGNLPDVLKVYEDGVYRRCGRGHGGGEVFLPWSVIEKIERSPYGGFVVRCGYGEYHFFEAGEAFGYLKTLHPEKFAEE